MVWVIIGCTVLIIVCLGGGMRLAQIILGAIAILAVAIFFGSAPAAEDLNISGSVSRSGIGAVVFVVIFFALMAYRLRQGPPRA